jgi:hypothetical protein
MKIISLHYRGGNLRIATATKGRYSRQLCCLCQIGVWQPFLSHLKPVKRICISKIIIYETGQVEQASF